MALVVLDAGHGGSDPGAVNGDRYEKNDNLNLTLAVGNILQNCGVNVKYTRSTDVYITLNERSNISNAAKADLFVSMHRNSSDNNTATGFGVHVYTSPTQQSLNLANNILNTVVDVGVARNLGVHNDNFAVLRNTNAPAVLVETNFISSTDDNALFDQNFVEYARAIASGILTTLGIKCGSGGDTSAPQSPKPPTTPDANIIRRIQQTLNEKYNVGIIVDGIWGAGSKRALVAALQLELNHLYGASLVVDGIWGPRTRAFVPILRIGDRGNIVWLLQAGMYVKGYHTNPDGIFGNDTQDTVRQVQAAANISVDGLAGKDTFSVVFS